MDIALVRRAAAAAEKDGAFRVNAQDWTGSLTLVSDQHAWQVRVRGGAPGMVDTRTAPEPTADDVVIRADEGTWAAFLPAPPPPGLVDLAGAAASGLVDVSPPAASAER